MKFSIEEASRLAAAGFLSSLLIACGSDNNNSNSGGDEEDNDHDHAHGALIISQDNSTAVSLFDEEGGDFDAFDEASSTTAPRFVRSDNGEFAALTGGSVVEFVGEDGFLEASVTGSQVVATNGHFSILNGNQSSFVEVDELEGNPASLTEETISGLGISETEVYPALMLDEDEDLVMVFVSGAAKLYEGANVVAGPAITCTNPSSTAQGHHAVMMTCDEGVQLVQFEEESSITYTITDITVTGANENAFIWTSTEHVFAGYAAGTTDYAIVHVEEDGTVDEVDVTASDALSLTDTICEAGVEGEDEDVLFWLSGGTFAAATNEAEPIGATGIIDVEDSMSTNCDDYSFTITEKVAFVFDNAAQKFHEIDIEEGATFYHVHETIDIPVSDIADTVAFIEHEEGEGGHGDHDDHDGDDDHDHDGDHDHDDDDDHSDDEA